MGTTSFSLLRMLADGRFHSGERLGRALGLSRGGVWNLIRRIEALGPRVLRVRGRGYRLAEALDLFELDGLAAGLKKGSPRPLPQSPHERPSPQTRSPPPSPA